MRQREYRYHVNCLPRREGTLAITRWVLQPAVCTMVRASLSVDVAGNVHLTGRFSLVLRVDNAVSDAARPGIGGAARLLDERRHGVAATGYLLLQGRRVRGTRKRTRSVGVVWALVWSGRGTANFAYGQDPEGNERDGEASIGVQIEPVERVSAGVLGRYRDALGSRGEAGVVRDVFAGALATATIGRVGVTGLFGVSGIETKTSGAIETGVSGVVAVGAAL